MEQKKMLMLVTKHGTQSAEPLPEELQAKGDAAILEYAWQLLEHFKAEGKSFIIFSHGLLAIDAIAEVYVINK